jgi:hypothetical protein
MQSTCTHADVPSATTHNNAESLPKRFASRGEGGAPLNLPCLRGVASRLVGQISRETGCIDGAASQHQIETCQSGGRRPWSRLMGLGQQEEGKVDADAVGGD